MTQITVQVALEAELRGLDLQANALRKHHDKLVQDRLSSTGKLAQLRDSLKVSLGSTFATACARVFSL